MNQDDYKELAAEAHDDYMARNHKKERTEELDKVLMDITRSQVPWFLDDQSS